MSESKLRPMTHTTPDQRVHAWFALAGTETCRLLHCTLTAQGTPNVVDDASIKNTLPDLEQLRPKGDNGAASHEDERTRRFAGKVIGWLQKRAEHHDIDRLFLFAPPHLLGVLRTIPPGSLKGHVEELKGDLMSLNVGELAEHPMIRALMVPRDS